MELGWIRYVVLNASGSGHDYGESDQTGLEHVTCSLLWFFASKTYTPFNNILPPPSSVYADARIAKSVLREARWTG